MRNKKIFSLTFLILFHFWLVADALPKDGTRRLPYGLEIKNEDPSLSKVLKVQFDTDDPILVKIGPSQSLVFLQTDGHGHSTATSVFSVKYKSRQATTLKRNGMFARIRITKGFLYGAVEGADENDLQNIGLRRDTGMAMRPATGSIYVFRSFDAVVIEILD